MEGNKTNSTPGSLCPFEENKIELSLVTPKWLLISISIIFFILLTPSFIRYSLNASTMDIIFIALNMMITSLFGVYLHENSHKWLLKLLNDDEPTIIFDLLRSCCIPNKPVPLDIFILDLIIPTWITGSWGIITTLLVIFETCKTTIWITFFSMVFSLAGQVSDFYWLYLLHNTPRDRYVICDGLSAIVYRDDEN